MLPRLSSSCASWAGLGLALGGCAPPPAVPDPEPVVEAYAQALERGDAEALYALLSAESRRSLSRAEVAHLLAEQRQELRDHARALRAPGREIRARAQVRYEDGEIASLDVVEGEFRVTASDGLPAVARTPAQALSQLRRVLVRRSYPGLLRVLSPRTRGAVETDLRGLVEGLSAPESLPVEVVGDTATVVIPGGHRVELRREEGVWLVDDFD